LTSDGNYDDNHQQVKYLKNIFTRASQIRETACLVRIEWPKDVRDVRDVRDVTDVTDDRDDRDDRDVRDVRDVVRDVVRDDYSRRKCLLYTKLLYDISYTGIIGLFRALHQYTSLFTVYEPPRIQSSAYTNLRLYEPPLIRVSAPPK
jgi:hypothetical protein